MKKHIISMAIFGALFLSGGVAAAEVSGNFDTSLRYGVLQSPEVYKLQEFLISEGLLNTSPTGNYLSLTQKAVMDFQIREGVSPATGYFGPLTRAAANSRLASREGSLQAKVSEVVLVNASSNLAAVGLLNYKTVNWKTSNYPQSAGVNINLLRMTSSSPRAFTLIRTISKNTPNDGTETWLPNVNETGDDVYLEVTCSDTYTFKGGCQLSNNLAKVN